MQDIVDILKISKSNIENYLYQLGYVNHFDVWIPYKLNKQTKNPLLDHISICESLLKCNEHIMFLKQIMMGDKNWIIYNNVEWKRSWGKQNEPLPTTPKSSLHPKVTYGGIGRESSVMSSFWKTK